MSMAEEKAQFYRAELTPTPSAFALGLSVDEITTVLNARWEAKKSASVVMLEDKLTTHEAENNGVVFCGTIRRDGKRAASTRAVDSVPGLKRPRVDEGSSSSSGRQMVDIECFLSNFKKDTLRKMKQDLTQRLTKM